MELPEPLIIGSFQKSDRNRRYIQETDKTVIISATQDGQVGCSSIILWLFGIKQLQLLDNLRQKIRFLLLLYFQQILCIYFY
jgi:hypothetical protein